MATKSSSQKTSEKASTEKEADSAPNTTQRVAEQAHEAVDWAAEHAGQAEERIREGMNSADEEVRERAAKARQGSEDVLRAVGNYIRENPLTAVGLAFVAGSLFSSLTRRR
ncbi:YqjD family protein [Thioalkalivibrio sp. ALJ7]|uniref:DUF883 family protein n=1 Tax=Thioalkalivibrio sp. ALJ7 TaxID=1158756 RepID=UPI000382380E|nr:hypothetical protein [Thioalkalivibrio sp. ALJ7]